MLDNSRYSTNSSFLHCRGHNDQQRDLRFVVQVLLKSIVPILTDPQMSTQSSHSHSTSYSRSSCSLKNNLHRVHTRRLHYTLVVLCLSAQIYKKSYNKSKYMINNENKTKNKR